MSAPRPMPLAGDSRRMLFHRRYEGYSGGHGKVWDYFNHALALGFDARVHFAAGSTLERGNPWAGVSERIESTWSPHAADVLFVAGMDWQAVPEGLESRVPVVNLLQHVRHADEGSALRSFLRRPALRLCVADAVAEAVNATGEANGPVVVLPAAIDVGVPADAARRGVLVDAIKRPDLGATLAAALRADGHEVDLVLEHRTRESYLRALASTAVAILLPMQREGLYLPALEAMALGTPVVTLDAVGNREYLQPGVNAVVPPPELGALRAAVTDLLADAPGAAAMVAHGRDTATRFSLAAEREAFATALRERLADWR